MSHREEVSSKKVRLDVALTVMIKGSCEECPKRNSSSTVPVSFVTILSMSGDWCMPCEEALKQKPPENC